MFLGNNIALNKKHNLHAYFLGCVDNVVDGVDPFRDLMRGEVENLYIIINVREI